MPSTGNLEEVTKDLNSPAVNVPPTSITLSEESPPNTSETPPGSAVPIPPDASSIGSVVQTTAATTTPQAPPPISNGPSWRRRTKRAPQRVISEPEIASEDDEDDDDVTLPSDELIRRSSDDLRRNDDVMRGDVTMRRSDDDVMRRLSGADVDDLPSSLHHHHHHHNQKTSLADSTSDVEKFEGKIVYNPDGSAYIIEDSELSEDESLPQLDGCIIDSGNSNITQSLPQIANAFYVTRNQQSLYTALYGQAYANLLREKKLLLPEVPIMHSYKVYSIRGGDKINEIKTALDDKHEVPIKPILMCFICKLSFGYTKSFISHAVSDHSLNLLDNEKEILSNKNTSAIIQCVGKEKETLISFLEPISPVLGRLQDLQSQHQSRAASPSVSLTAATMAANAMKSLMANLPQENLDQDTSSLQKQGMDLSQPNKSPIESPYHQLPSSSYPSNLPQTPNFLTGTTIGVCPDHMTGRPSGVDCGKCEMILNNSRLGQASGQGGLLAGIHSRNSCKTLKCPKCNWHYKYQETLEIHMKEKHPENETSCIYCIAGQPHPRLARGETYTCGYKPYRCEVCNYSTTTKGNLSIHMQSDKHLNNMQELQNGNPPSEQQGATTPTKLPPQSALSPPTPQREVPSSPVSNKPKPTFRCDVCNYETNVARNLRIHMTSEKHTHNMMVLQQNVKHMQQLSALQQAAQSQMAAAAAGGAFDPAAAAALLHFHPGLTLQGDKPPPHTEAALADMAYNQALLIQMMTGGQLPPHVPPELAPHMDLGLNPDTMEPPPEPPDPNPSFLFQCCVCTGFSTDSLEALSHHLSQDRTKLREQEILALVGGNYVCKLCTYKTNLKANFQLHCKTDKHLQRLQHVNHIKEGGARNEWKLKFVSVSNPVQVRCHACDYYTNSAHKLQLHAAHQRHEVSRMVFRHLANCEAALRDQEPKIYHCALCGFSTRAKLPLLQHVRSMKHLQMEQIHQLQRRSEGKEPHTEIGEVFQVVAQSQLDANMQLQLAAEQPNTSATESPPADRSKERRGSTSSASGGSATPAPTDPASMLKFALEGQTESSDETSPERTHSCPYCNFNSSSEMRIQAHILAQHQTENNNKPDFLCPLCQDGFKEKSALERHVMQIHSVNAEGLQRLLLLVDQSHWLNNRPEGAPDEEAMDTDEPSEDLKCQLCNKSCSTLDELCVHQTETGHLELKQTPNGPGYLCWKKGCNQYFNTAVSLQNHYREIHAVKIQPPMAAVSEKHVYKYRCNQCSLAFKTLEKLQLHSQYHLIRDATKCMLCGRSFRSVLALHKHVETSHTELSEDELAQYKQSLMNNPLLLASLGSGQGSALESACAELMKRASNNSEEPNSPIDEDMQEDGDGEGENSNDSMYKEQQFLEDYLNSQAIAEDSYNDPNRKYKCHRCKVAFTRQSYLTSHNKTLLHRKGEKLSYPMEKYLDPNRPYKCDVCKESFTQKNILLVHYNSVSHLHKLKRAMQDQQSSQNNLNNNNSLPATAPNSLKVEDPDQDKKPYKCNICKVAYTQGSTLDIHMRSVLHQTRASKLQELALTGQIDLSRPLIEQPEHRKMSGQQQEMSPKQVSPRSPSNNTESPNSSGSLPSGAATSSSPNVTPNNSSLQISAVTPTSSNTSAHACGRCNALFPSGEQLSQHQALYCLGFQNSPQNKTPSPTPPAPLNTSTPAQMLHDEQFLRMAAKKPSQMYKHLLESYGFELVMQFNENHQRRRRELQEQEKLQQQEAQQAPVPAQQAQTLLDPAPDTTAILPEEEPVIPEVTKSTCQHCKKEFSSVWVLKAHCEEVHRDLVPHEFLEKYAQQFKHEYEKKSSDEEPEDSKEALAKLEVAPTPPAPSTPVTPASSTDSVPQNQQQQQSLAQQMSEMQAALNAMAASQLQQLQFNPMMLMGMGLPLGLNMPALAAMNLQPPLVPMMMPPPFDPLSPLFQPQMDPQMMSKQPPQPQQSTTPQPGPSAAQSNASNASQQQKRARTRITDDQLKILRAHFDINNSPSEEQITDMASQSGLPPKVIKHWFRNTLFKERQRNKDSPYNFNNPPSTTLNLEEYEKTGEAKVMPLSSEEQKSIQQLAGAVTKKQKAPKPVAPPPEQPEVKIEQPEVEPEPKMEPEMKMMEMPELPPPPMQPASPVPSNLTLSNLINNQLSVAAQMGPTELNIPQAPVTTSPASSSSSNCSNSSMLPPKMAPNFALQTPQTSVLPPISPARSPGHMDFQPSGNSNGSTSSGGSSSGKRANRTRFTDYQIKVLQEFFENNAYPKDDDLEYLSKLLNLSPRVIVVWFQNARQKARKVYENQPQVETTADDGTGRFQRTPGLNYQCKKCLLVFQRYYELIRHQKTHCFKEEDAKRSAQAQAAAAQIAAVLSSEDSNSSAEPGQNMMQGTPQNLFAPSPGPQQMEGPPKSPAAQEGTFQCDKCNLVFPRFDLWREHQLVHIMNPNLFPTYPPDSPFGILQQHAQQQQQMAASISGESSDPGTPKRKLDDFDDDPNCDQPKDKRLRTTILPEQLDYLYQKYQIESNPSRKMLENIAREVGLKKRVVQVWFQNTRARERKGQFRAHAQVINKRCPFCPALFKVKSALESHLVTKHADQCTRGEINIDALPDEELSMESTSYTSDTPKSFNTSTTPPASSNMMPPIFPPFGHEMENSLKKYYEESMKRYISELQTHTQNNTASQQKDEMKHEGGETPLDLSKPVDLSRPMLKINTDNSDSRFMEGPLTDLSIEEQNHFLVENRSDSLSDFEDNFDESNPGSPASSTQSKPSGPNSNNKRFRTQMSSLQVKVMKSLFNDYKTPTMAECEMLGREIGLPKRVVQVWFQNARAKEKKNKLALQKTFGTEIDIKAPEECKLCVFKYSHKYSIQDHIFTKKHIDNVKTYIESGRCSIESSDSQNDNLQQMMASLPQPTVAAIQAALANNNKDKPEEMALLQQLYLASQQQSSSAGGPNNMFVHPAMFPPNTGGPSSNNSSAHVTAGSNCSVSNNTGNDPPNIVGTPLSIFQLPHSTMHEIGKVSNVGEPCVTTIRFTMDITAIIPNQLPLHCTHLEKEAAFICKKCQLAFPSETTLLGHQRMVCFAGKLEHRGAIRLVQQGFECKLCNDRLSTFNELKLHCNTELHLNNLHNRQHSLSPSEGLTHEMEDVVNQITALAAQASSQSDPSPQRQITLEAGSVTG